VDITTYNIGQVDSAANLIFCAGKHRYALPDTRFLIHSAFNIVPPGTPLNTAYLDGQLQQVKNMNRLSQDVIETTIGKPSKDIEDAIQGQGIFDPQQALKLGLIQEVKPSFFTPGAAVAEIAPAATTPTSGAMSSGVFTTSTIGSVN
jgi:ATP-dependent protease ClpP protease subunit